MNHFVAVIASSERYAHAEGPTWNASSQRSGEKPDQAGRALWVDITNGDVYQATVAEAGSKTSRSVADHSHRLLNTRLVCHVDGTVGAVLPSAAPTPPGATRSNEVSPSLVLAAGTRFVYYGSQSYRMANAAALPGVSADVIRFNDAKVDPWGQIVAGTMAFDAVPDAGALYRLTPNGGITTLLPRATISNGMAWSSNGAVMYYIDSATGGIDSFDYDPTGVLRNRRRFATIPLDIGSPDGMCIDIRGRIWVAIWGGSQVRCYSPDGKLAATVEVDAPNVSSCAFVGEHLDLLLITTSQLGLSETELQSNPNSGRLFLADVRVSGQPQARFGAGLLA